MNSRVCIIGLSLFICWEANCAAGFCAGLNEQEAAAPALTYKADQGANQPVARLGETKNSNLDTDRKLSPNDEISVTVYQEEDLAKKTIIDKNGMVMLPLLGQVKVGGLTTGEATSLIQQLYDKDYLVNPQVNLIIEKFASRRYSVLGQVQRPGTFDFPQNESVNLKEAIATAGSYTRLGSPSKVTVERMVNGVGKKIPLDVEKMSKDPKNKQFEIMPGDVITVGERTF